MSDNSLAIWKNNRKEKETHPDFSVNNVELDGKEYDVAVWIRQTKKGDDYLSVKFSPPYKSKEEREAFRNERQVDGPSTDTQPGKHEEDLPF